MPFREVLVHGKDCTDSSQCQGMCIPYSDCITECIGEQGFRDLEFDDQICDKKYTGYCEKTKSPKCGDNIELKNGNMIYSGYLACD